MSYPQVTRASSARTRRWGSALAARSRRARPARSARWGAGSGSQRGGGHERGGGHLRVVVVQERGHGLVERRAGGEQGLPRPEWAAARISWRPRRSRPRGRGGRPAGSAALPAVGAVGMRRRCAGTSPRPRCGGRRGSRRCTGRRVPRPGGSTLPGAAAPGRCHDPGLDCRIGMEECAQRGRHLRSGAAGVPQTARSGFGRSGGGDSGGRLVGADTVGSRNDDPPDGVTSTVTFGERAHDDGPPAVRRWAVGSGWAILGSNQ